MADFQLTTPVAFLIFNRPDTTARVFEAIRQAKPPKLLVVADGPRADRPDDVEKCKAARAIIDGVDWDCEVLRNYSDINLGCKKRVSSGLDWVFEIVEEAIILEDDCLPHTTFFRFCEELLDYYRNDKRIMVVSGSNFRFGRNCTEYSYYLSRFPYCWGWATWRRAWQYYDYEMKLWEEIRDGQWFQAILEDTQAMKYWTKVFQDTYDNHNKSWAYRWLFACWVQSGLAMIPGKNLVSNIGFTKEATHTNNTKSLLNKIPTEEMFFPLRHPPMVIRDVNADKLSQETVFKKKLSINRVIISGKMYTLQNLKYLRYLSNKFARLLSPDLPYNLTDQNSIEWDERSSYACKIALDYLNSIEKDIESDLIIGDFGCGKQRIKRHLDATLNNKFIYKGYDVLPQSETIIQMNFNYNFPEDGSFNLVFSLGLLEYIHDLNFFFTSLRKVCQSAIISYVHKSHHFCDEERIKLGWVNHYTIDELETILIGCGFKCVNKHIFNKQVIFLIS